MEKIREVIAETIGELFGISEEEVSVEVVGVPEGIKADLACNVAMRLAGKLDDKQRIPKWTPREVAGEIKEGILRRIEGGGKAEDAKFAGLERLKIEVVGPGFLNFILPDGYLGCELAEFAGLEGDFKKKISQDEYAGKVVVTEFSDPNPFKVLHIGHLYTSVMGESMSRLIELAGGEVHRVNFGGDVGLHVAKTLFCATHLSEAASASEGALLTQRMSNTSRSVAPSSLNLLSEKASAEEAADFLARCYVSGTRAYEEDEEAKKEIIRLNKLIYKIVEMGEGKIEGLDEEEERIAKMYWRGRELSYKYFVQFYNRIGVKFEKFYPESSVVDRGVKEVLRAKAQGVYEESEGAVIFPGEKYGLHTRVFVNKEGVPTYETKDVGLLFTKYDDYKFDTSVVITGNEQADYMKVVLKSVEQFAPELVQKSKHITHGMVRLPGDEKMSSRKGNFVKAVEILDEIGEKVEKNETLALAAIKYAFLKYKIGGNIVFDKEESVSVTGNSGVYLLYSYVRAKKILSAQTVALEDVREGSLELELNEFERELCKKFMEYLGVLKEAVKNLAPHLVANYLYELAKEFSRFYEHCRVAGDERERERLRMVLAFERILKHGLGLLGIETLDEM